MRIPSSQEEPTMGDETATEASFAQARSAAYRLIALGFRYPDNEWSEMILASSHWAFWPDVLRQMDGGTADQVLAVRSKAESVLIGWDRGEITGLNDLQETFVELFGHTVRGNCPPYEFEYGRSEIIQRASELADVAGFYSAFGLELEAQSAERPDHVSAECEFMCVLCAKEAHATAEGHERDRDTAHQAQRSFLRDHLAQWLPTFAQRVERMDSDGLYGALARFASGFVGGDCRRFGITTGPSRLELRPIDPKGEATINCGVEESCPSAAADSLVQLNVECGGHVAGKP